MIQYLLCLRPLNLFIVAMTQILCYHFIFLSKALPANVNWVLAPPGIYLFTIVTVCIAAGGYLINDYFDYESDRYNDKRHRLSNKFTTLKYYAVVLILGFLLAFKIAIDIGKPPLAGIYIVASALLYLYSSHWKKQVLIGNLVVSGFTAFVIVMLLYAEQDVISSLSRLQHEVVVNSILAFSTFAFLINMVREIIKDIEDIEGDKAEGYKTMPISMGIPKSRIVASFYGIVLLFVLFGWMWYAAWTVDVKVLGFCSFTLFAPLVFILFKLLRTKTALPSSLLSTMCKLMMISGLFLLIYTQKL